MRINDLSSFSGMGAETVIYEIQERSPEDLRKQLGEVQREEPKGYSSL